jgi:hypothetical protein
MGVGRFCRVLGIPLAEARLLAIEEERSRAFALRTPASLGGPVASGEVDLLSLPRAVSAEIAAADASRIAGRGSTSSRGFSCLVLMI